MYNCNLFVYIVMNSYFILGTIEMYCFMFEIYTYN